jgi:putative DNA primase/helicase
MDVYALGKSTEPGIRQELKTDARPVTMDESESNEEDDIRRIQNILGLIRQASSETGAKTYKGTASGQALSFDVRSMFCLASIQVALKQKADIDRLTVLGLRSTSDAEKASAGEEWRALREILHGLHKKQELPARLLRRAIDMLPVTLQNITVFSDAAADRFGSQRDGDQYGTLLAGAWSLISTEVATREQALELIDRYDWSEHRDMADSDESQKALSALMEAHIRIERGIEVTVYELVRCAVGNPTGTLDLKPEAAADHLMRHGLKVKDGHLLLSNTSTELKRMMAGTGFEADLRGVLLRTAGASKWNNKAEKFSGVPTKVIALPLKPLVGDLPPAAPF